MPHTVVPVILAGGSGTRLWPLSRKNFPKQFLCLQGENSLLQQTAKRAFELEHESCLIISNDAHYFICQEQLQAFEKKITYLLEPCPRNTAPAIASGAHYLAQIYGESVVMVVMPSDHWIAEDANFLTALLHAVDYAGKHDSLITFGIKPTGPKTGYGYIEAGDSLAHQVFSIHQFREKPDLETAKNLLETARHYWNSGMFIFQAGSFLNELKTHAPDIYFDTQKSLARASYHHDFIRLEGHSFSSCRNESIDYAVMEKTKKASVIPLEIPWSDLGCWTSVAEANQADENGNTVQGNVIAKDSQDCLITTDEILVTTLGIKDQIIVATKDAILVADKRYSQQVKDLVQDLGKKHGDLAKDHRQVARPWGYYEVLAEGETFKVKRLMVKPGAKLSLQSHEHRAEHWVVVSGEAEVINDTELLRLTMNQSTYIPKRARHRLSNVGEAPLYVIEVQSGDYLGEDDIKRYDDVYKRETVA